LSLQTTAAEYTNYFHWVVANSFKPSQIQTDMDMINVLSCSRIANTAQKDLEFKFTSSDEYGRIVPLAVNLNRCTVYSDKEMKSRKFCDNRLQYIL